MVEERKTTPPGWEHLAEFHNMRVVGVKGDGACGWTSIVIAASQRETALHPPTGGRRTFAHGFGSVPLAAGIKLRNRVAAMWHPSRLDEPLLRDTNYDAAPHWRGVTRRQFLNDFLKREEVAGMLHPVTAEQYHDFLLGTLHPAVPRMGWLGGAALLQASALLNVPIRVLVVDGDSNSAHAMTFDGFRAVPRPDLPPLRLVLASASPLPRRPPNHYSVLQDPADVKRMVSHLTNPAAEVALLRYTEPLRQFVRARMRPLRVGGTVT